MKTTPPESGLHWNDSEMDRVCQKIPDFGIVAFVARDSVIFERIWELASLGLLSKAREYGLRARLQASTGTVESDLASRLAADAVDLLVLRLDSATGTEEAGLTRLIAQSNCAILLLCKVLSHERELGIEYRLDFSEKSVELKEVGTEAPAQSLPCDLFLTPVLKRTTITARPAEVEKPIEAIQVKPATAESQKLLIEFLGLSSADQKFLIRELDLETSEWNASGKTAQLLVMKADCRDPLIAPKVREQLARGAKVVALASGLQRDEDRKELLKWGVSVILPPQAQLDEVAFAILNQLPLLRQKREGRLGWEAELAQRLRKVSPHSHWDLEELDEVTQLYAPAVSLILNRGMDLSLPAGALVVSLPELPESIRAEGWGKLFATTLLQGITRGVRSTDIAIIIANHLVLFSASMGPVSAKAVVRRMAKHLEGAVKKELKWSWITSQFGPAPGYGVATLFKEVSEVLQPKKKERSK